MDHPEVLSVSPCLPFMLVQVPVTKQPALFPGDLMVFLKAGILLVDLPMVVPNPVEPMLASQVQMWQSLRIDAATKAFLRKVSVSPNQALPQRSQAIATKRTNVHVGEKQFCSSEKVLSYISVASVLSVQKPECKPTQMIKNLKAGSGSASSKDLFVNKSRLEAICGNMVSVRETATAVRCWTELLLP